MIAEFFPNFIIFSFFLLVSIGSYAQEQKNFSVEGMTGGTQKIELTHPEEIEIAKSLIYEYKKFRKIYSDCLKDKTSISECMCNHTDSFEEYSKAYYDAFSYTGDKFYRNSNFYFYDQGVKRTLNLHKTAEIESEFRQYCVQDINKEYLPVPEMEQPPLAILKKDEAKQLYSLYLYERNLNSADGSRKCSKLGEEQEEKCTCNKLDNYKVLSVKAEKILDHHPDWKGRRLKFFWKGYEYGPSLSAYVRSYKSLEKYCGKKES